MSKLHKCIFIVKCLMSHKHLTRQEINDMMNRRWPYEQELSRSSFGRYIEYINEHFPFIITFSQVSKLYSIDQKHTDKIDEELSQYLLSIFDIEASAPLLVKHKDRVHRIENITGVDNLHTILQAIDEQRGIECDYQSFTQATKKHRTFIPLFITTWEGRWYCVAEVTTHPESQPYTYALERMNNVTLTNDHYVPRYKGTYHELFKNSYGIFISQPKDEPKDIIIKAYGAKVEYLRAKPIHPSQIEIGNKIENDKSIEATFKLSLIPCPNFYQQILWNLDGIEVIEPLEIREETKRIINDIQKKYNK